MRNSHSHRSVAPITIKRIYRDLKEIEDNPLPGISICMPNPDDPLTLHGNILIMDGLYSDLLIHIIVHLPSEYPIVGPAVNIAPGLSFGSRFHEHIDDDPVHGNQICADLLTNVDFVYEGGKREKSGWTPSYTLSTVLLHLQVFFADPDRNNMYPDQWKIESLRRHVQQFKISIDLPNGKTAVHSFENPYPPLPVKTLQTDQIVAKKDDAVIVEEEEKSADPQKEAEQWLYCAISKCSIFDDSKPVLGYPLDIRRDSSGRYWPKPLLEMISYNAFMQNIESESKNFEFCEYVGLKSSFGEPYNFWIPVYINEEHYKRCHERIFKAIKEICRKCSGTSTMDFHPNMVLTVLPVILSKIIVRILKNELHQSVAVIQAYWQFYRLLVRLLSEFPELKEIIHAMAKKVMKEQPGLQKSDLSPVRALEAANLVLTSIPISEVDARIGLLPKAFIEGSLKKLDWIQRNALFEESWGKIKQSLQLDQQISPEGELINLLIRVFDVSAKNNKHRAKRPRRPRSRSRTISRSRSRRRHSRSHRRQQSRHRSAHRHNSRRHRNRGERSRSRSKSRRRRSNHRRRSNSRDRRDSHHQEQRYERRVIPLLTRENRSNSRNRFHVPVLNNDRIDSERLMLIPNFAQEQNIRTFN